MNKHEPDDDHVTRREFVGSVVCRQHRGRSYRRVRCRPPTPPLFPRCTAPSTSMVTKAAVARPPNHAARSAARESNLTGTKKGCDHGQCGACTVLVNGRRINSCLTLAVTHEGDQHHHHRRACARATICIPMQAAFLEHDGFQCGYCTPGQICSAVALLDEVQAGMPSAVTPDVAQARADRT